ncbi:MAG: hypothetical protein ACYDCH_02835 [Gaiellaceae bacterium]
MLGPDEERRVAADLYNRTWTFLERTERTPDDDEEMVHCAHASAYHWRQVGTEANRARGEWLCARVYAVLGRAPESLYHAQRCLAIVEAHPADVEDWDEPAALEALARAHAVAGDVDEARRLAGLGRTLAAQIADDGDRTQIEADLAAIPAMAV